MSGLVIEGLRVAVEGDEALRGIDLAVGAGEIHAVIGPDDSGLSALASAIAGRPKFEVLGGSVRLGDVELLDEPPWRRAEAGLFLAMSSPTEVPDVTLRDLLSASARTPTDPVVLDERMRAAAVGADVPVAFLDRPVNVGLSSGDKKRHEILQLGMLQPGFAVLDEFDSGLDADELETLTGRIGAAVAEAGLGVLAISHSVRLFEYLRPDVVHVFADGRIEASGGPELAIDPKEI